MIMVIKDNDRNNHTEQNRTKHKKIKIKNKNNDNNCKSKLIKLKKSVALTPQSVNSRLKYRSSVINILQFRV